MPQAVLQKAPPQHLKGLNRYGLLAEENLRLARPKFYRALLKNGRLNKRLESAQSMASLAVSQMVQAGHSLPEAEEYAVREFLNWESEEDQPELGGPVNRKP